MLLLLQATALLPDVIEELVVQVLGLADVVERLTGGAQRVVQHLARFAGIQ